MQEQVTGSVLGFILLALVKAVGLIFSGLLLFIGFAIGGVIWDSIIKKKKEDGEEENCTTLPDEQGEEKEATPDVQKV